MLMSFHAWVVFVGALALALLGIWQMPSIWHGRGEDLLPYRKPSDWRYDQPLWRGFIRFRALSGPWFLAAAAIWLSEKADLGEPADRVLDIVAHVLAPLWLLLPLTITLFNRPRRLVPERWRHERGALAEWFGPPPRSTSK